MQVKEILDNEKNLWNDFVAWYPTGDLLQSFEWGELKQRSGEWQPIRLAVEDENGITAAISILKRQIPRIGKTILYAPRGPVCDFSDTRTFSTLMDSVSSLAKRENAIFLKIDPPLFEANLADALTAQGFAPIRDEGFGGVQPRCVMQLDLRPSMDELLADCKPKWRYNIRLAEKKGVNIRLDCAKDDLKVFYDLLKVTAERDGFMIRDFRYYNLMWDILVEREFAKLFLAEYQGEPVAGALAFIFGDKCWYVYGASSNQHRNVMPNHLMQWRMIEWAKESGCAVYDFRGVSQKKDQAGDDRLAGLNRFKEGFGAKFVEFIGEYDKPFSSFWYWAWVVGKPRAVSAMKQLKKSRSGASAGQSQIRGDF